jgi:hypothetical protein
MPRGGSTELAEVLPRGNKSVGGPKGVCPLVAGRGFMPRPRRGGREPWAMDFVLSDDIMTFLLQVLTLRPQGVG